MVNYFQILMQINFAKFLDNRIFKCLATIIAANFFGYTANAVVFQIVLQELQLQSVFGWHLLFINGALLNSMAASNAILLFCTRFGFV